MSQPTPSRGPGHGEAALRKANTSSAKNTTAVRPTPNPRPDPGQTTAATLTTDLGRQIRNEVKEFKAGRAPWASLDQLRRRADALRPNHIADPAVERTLRAESARIKQQGRSLGDDTGWDAVKLLKSSILDAQAGRIGHPQLTRAFLLVKTSRERHQNHWGLGVRENAKELEDAARTKALQLLSERDERVARKLTDAQRTWRRSASPADLNELLKQRDAASTSNRPSEAFRSSSPILNRGGSLNRAESSSLRRSICTEAGLMVRDEAPYACALGAQPLREPSPASGRGRVLH